MRTLRLASLLACVALITSRLGLVAHELVGHGGTALAVGAKIRAVQLFYFAGGWIRYDLPDSSLAPALAIAMGGIAVELVAGTALLVSLRRRTDLAGKLLRGIGAALLVHAGWYLATGAWHGFGDGVLLHRVLGDARYPVAIAAGAGTVAAAYIGARGVFGALAGTLPGTPRRRALGLAAAIVLAGGLHAALAFGELRLRRDATYTETMASERDRAIAADLEKWQRSHPDAAPELREREQVKIERSHRTFPFAWLLGAVVVAAVVAGALRSRSEPHAITRRMLVLAARAAAFSIALVIVLDAAM